MATATDKKIYTQEDIIQLLKTEGNWALERALQVLVEKGVIPKDDTHYLYAAHQYVFAHPKNDRRLLVKDHRSTDHPGFVREILCNPKNPFLDKLVEFANEKNSQS